MKEILHTAAKGTNGAGARILRGVLWAAGSLAFLAVVWLIAWRAAGNEYVVPSPAASLREAGRLLGTGTFWRAFGGTLSRALTAFAASFLAAVIFSVAAYLVPSLGKFLAPLVSVVRSLPTMAVILIILVWATPLKAPVIVSCLALFPMLYTGMSAALAAVPAELVEMSRVYKVPVRRRIVGLYLPCAAPYVLRESSAALSFALKLTVSAEVLASTYRSLGGLMQEAKLYLEMPRLFALTLTVLAAGFVLEGAGMLLARAAERRAAWK